MTQPSDVKLFFVDTATFEDGATIRGGLLVSDIETKPYEFRCTSPVKPSTMQRVLYGDTLDEYISVELMGVPLVKAAKEKPSLILVRKPVLLRMRPKLDCPVVLIRPDQKSAMRDDSESDMGIKPIVLTAHKEFPTDSTTANAMLSSLIQRRDLLEPFERLSVALNEAHKQKIGETSTGGARG